MANEVRLVSRVIAVETGSIVAVNGTYLQETGGDELIQFSERDRLRLGLGGRINLEPDAESNGDSQDPGTITATIHANYLIRRAHGIGVTLDVGNFAGSEFTVVRDVPSNGRDATVNIGDEVRTYRSSAFSYTRRIRLSEIMSLTPTVGAGIAWGRYDIVFYSPSLNDGTDLSYSGEYSKPLVDLSFGITIEPSNGVGIFGSAIYRHHFGSIEDLSITTESGPITVPDVVFLRRVGLQLGVSFPIF